MTSEILKECNKKYNELKASLNDDDVLLFMDAVYYHETSKYC